jgi:NAD(P)-dependent dehydrogenase (short-subunit alcohol dehydrogenase family)
MTRSPASACQALPTIAARETECTTSMEGKTCVITGATSGTGRAAAQALAAMGARILMIARNNQRGEAMLAELRDRFAGADHSVHYAGLLQFAEVKRVATDANMLELRGSDWRVLTRKPRMTRMPSGCGRRPPNWLASNARLHCFAVHRAAVANAAQGTCKFLAFVCHQ